MDTDIRNPTVKSIDGFTKNSKFICITLIEKKGSEVKIFLSSDRPEKLLFELIDQLRDTKIDWEK